MIYFLGFQIEQIRLRLVNWRINQMSRKITSSKQIHALVKMIGKIHQIDRVSLSLVKNETFEHWLFGLKKHTPTKIDGQNESSVVSKVYASGKSLIHLNANRALGEKLSNKKLSYDTDFYSAFPIQIKLLLLIAVTVGLGIKEMVATAEFVQPDKLDPRMV